MDVLENLLTVLNCFITFMINLVIHSMLVIIIIIFFFAGFAFEVLIGTIYNS